MRGFSISWIPVIVCILCNENIVERADESEITTIAKAEAYARRHRQEHIRDGSWPARGPIEPVF